MTKIRLDNRTMSWIRDRVDNGESLMWNEFIAMSKFDEYDVSKYKTKKYKKAVILKYNWLKEKRD